MNEIVLFLFFPIAVALYVRSLIKMSELEEKYLHQLRLYDAMIRKYAEDKLCLDKLEKELDDVLEKETPESLNKWLSGKRNRKRGK